jgi:hypothetical protein
VNRTVYVVRRLSWTIAYEAGLLTRTGYEDYHPGVPIRVFADSAAAEEFCRALEEQARAVVPPGRIVGMGSPNSDPADLADETARLGLPPFVSDEEWLDGDELLRWWETVAADATPEQRAGVWELLKDVRFYDVVETTLED